MIHLGVLLPPMLFRPGLFHQGLLLPQPPMLLNVTDGEVQKREKSFFCYEKMLLNALKDVK